MADAFRIRLAQEELIYLLRALKISSLPGLGARPLGALDMDHQTLALAVADRTLQARGVITRLAEQERRLDPTVAGLLQACSQARHTLSLVARRTAPLGYQTLLTSFAEGIAVEQSLVAPGIHEFVALGTTSDMIARLSLLLRLDETPAGPGEPAHMRADTLTAALREPLPEPDTLRQQLHTELPTATADGLASILAAPAHIYQLTLSAAPSNPGAPPILLAALTIAQADAGLYLFTSGTSAVATSSSVTVTPATPAQARAATERLLRPALDLLPRDSKLH